MGRPAARPSRRAGRSQAAPAVRRRQGAARLLPTAGFPWRAASLALILALGGASAFIFTNDAFVVRRAEIGGVRYVPPEEVFTESGIAGRHVLQVDPAQVEARLETLPSLDSATVSVEWPARVVIRVREREPALMWEQGGQRYWVDLNGHLMVARRDIPNLLRVVNEGEAIPYRCPGPLCAEQDAITIDQAVVLGAQHLKTLRSNIELLYYDPVRGLSYQDGRGWRAYFGVGANMDVKLIVYEQLVAALELRGVRPLYIDVSNPDAPYYRIAQ
jgi:cell division protein FtsQ